MVDDCYEQQEFQPVSYHDPNDGKVTPQESQIRQEENRIEIANDEMKNAAVEGGLGVAGATVGVVSNQPYATNLAGGAVLHSVGREVCAYSTKEAAQAKYDQKVAEEKMHLDNKGN